MTSINFSTSICGLYLAEASVNHAIKTERGYLDVAGGGNWNSLSRSPRSTMCLPSRGTRPR